MLVSLFATRYLPDLIALCIVTLAQTAFAWTILLGPGRQSMGRVSQRPWLSMVAAWAISVAALTLGFLLRFGRVARHFPAWVAGWGRGSAGRLRG